MGSVGASELLIILLVALLVLGPERLPEAARQVGRAIGELRRMSAGFQAEIRDALEPPVPGTPPPAGEDGRHRWNDLPAAPEADGERGRAE